MLYAIGLGDKSGDISVRGMEIVKRADTVILKTGIAQCGDIVKQIGKPYITLDKCYQSADDFDALNSALCGAVLEAENGVTAYLVPYTPENDLSVAELKKRVQVEIVSAPAHTSALSQCCAPSYTAVSAHWLKDSDAFDYDRDTPLIIYDVDTEFTAADVKLFVTEVCGDEADCVFFDGETKRIKAYEIDRQSGYGYRAEVMVMPSELTERTAYSYYDLISVLKRLRAPGGCPWDRAQTHESIKSNLVEEAYELVEAIELADPDKLREESGDVLLQAVFHAAIGTEENEFSYREMMDELCRKLVFRHSHIFGGDTAASAEGALDVWEKNKLVEKRQESLYDTLVAVPKQFPALLRLYKVLKKVGKAGRLKQYDTDALFKEFCSKADADSFCRLIFAEVAALEGGGTEPEVALQSRIDDFVKGFSE